MAKMGIYYGTAADLTQQDIDTIKLWIFLRKTTKADFFGECLKKEIQRDSRLRSVVSKMLPKWIRNNK